MQQIPVGTPLPTAPPGATPRQWLQQLSLAWRLLLPALIAILLAVLIDLLRLDLSLADLMYRWEGLHWALRTAVLTESVIHVLGRELSTLSWVVIAAGFGVACRHPSWRRYRRPLACLLGSMLLSTLVVAWIKSWSNMDCPWDLARYGGARAYLDLFAMRPESMPHASCFPAGHASAGYAWMALYFYWLAVRPAWRWRGLGIGLTLGLLFGISQQLRGAHFVSHDLWTAALCWSVAVVVHALARQPLQPARPGR